MAEEIIIDVSNCPHKSDDDCMEVPICNEYGDLMGYQSCEAQTLCPYRTERIIDRLKQENERLRGTDGNIHPDSAYYKIKQLKQENEELKEKIKDKPLQCLLYNDKQNKCALFTKTVAYHCALEEIKRVINLAYRVEDYLLEQDYTDLVDRIEKELEVLGNESN